MYSCMNHGTWNLSKNETEWSLTPHEWTLTPTLHCQVEPEPADLHAIVCVHCPFTLFYPMNRQSFQHPSPCLVLLSLHNKWLPMDCVPLRHYVLRHRGLLQSSVLQMRSVLLDAFGNDCPSKNIIQKSFYWTRCINPETAQHFFKTTSDNAQQHLRTATCISYKI